MSNFTLVLSDVNPLYAGNRLGVISKILSNGGNYAMCDYFIQISTTEKYQDSVGFCLDSLQADEIDEVFINLAMRLHDLEQDLNAYYRNYELLDNLHDWFCGYVGALQQFSERKNELDNMPIKDKPAHAEGFLHLYRIYCLNLNRLKQAIIPESNRDYKLYIPPFMQNVPVASIK